MSEHKTCLIYKYERKLSIKTLSITKEEHLENFAYWVDHRIENVLITLGTNLITITGTEFFIHTHPEYHGDKISDDFLKTIHYDLQDVKVKKDFFTRKLYSSLRYGNYLLKRTKPFSLITSVPFEISE